MSRRHVCLHIEVDLDDAVEGVKVDNVFVVIANYKSTLHRIEVDRPADLQAIRDAVTEKLATVLTDDAFLAPEK